MAVYLGTQVYLRIGATVFNNYWKRVELTTSAETRDVTRGNADHRQRATALKDSGLSIAIGYDTNLDALISALDAGAVYEVEIGPEGNIAGEPRHVQNFILSSVPLRLDAGKEEVVFDLSFEAEGGPTLNMFKGAKY